MPERSCAAWRHPGPSSPNPQSSGPAAHHSQACQVLIRPNNQVTVSDGTFSITRQHLLWIITKMTCSCHAHAEAKAKLIRGAYRGNLRCLRNILKKQVLVLRWLVWRDFDLDVIHLPFCFTMDPAQMSRKV